MGRQKNTLILFMLALGLNSCKVSKRRDLGNTSQQPLKRALINSNMDIGLSLFGVDDLADRIIADMFRNIENSTGFVKGGAVLDIGATMKEYSRINGTPIDVNDLLDSLEMRRAALIDMGINPKFIPVISKHDGMPKAVQKFLKEEAIRKTGVHPKKYMPVEGYQLYFKKPITKANFEQELKKGIFKDHPDRSVKKMLYGGNSPELKFRIDENSGEKIYKASELELDIWKNDYARGVGGNTPVKGKSGNGNVQTNILIDFVANGGLVKDDVRINDLQSRAFLDEFDETRFKENGWIDKYGKFADPEHLEVAEEYRLFAEKYGIVYKDRPRDVQKRLVTVEVFDGKVPLDVEDFRKPNKKMIEAFVGNRPVVFMKEYQSLASQIADDDLSEMWSSSSKSRSFNPSTLEIEEMARRIGANYDSFSNIRGLGESSVGRVWQFTSGGKDYIIKEPRPSPIIDPTTNSFNTEKFIETYDRAVQSVQFDVQIDSPEHKNRRAARMSSIADEFKYEKESRLLEFGHEYYGKYSDSLDTIRHRKLLVESNKTTLFIMDMAEGVPVTSYIKNMHNEMVPENITKTHKSFRELRKTWYSVALYDGFVHRDPHGGNIVYNSSTGKSTFIDYGRAGTFYDEALLVSKKSFDQQFLDQKLIFEEKKLVIDEKYKLLNQGLEKNNSQYIKNQIAKKREIKFARKSTRYDATLTKKRKIDKKIEKKIESSRKAILKFEDLIETMFENKSTDALTRELKRPNSPLKEISKLNISGGDTLSFLFDDNFFKRAQIGINEFEDVSEFRRSLFKMVEGSVHAKPAMSDFFRSANQIDDIEFDLHKRSKILGFNGTNPYKQVMGQRFTATDIKLYAEHHGKPPPKQINTSTVDLESKMIKIQELEKIIDQKNSRILFLTNALEDASDGKKILTMQNELNRLKSDLDELGNQNLILKQQYQIAHESELKKYSLLEQTMEEIKLKSIQQATDIKLKLEEIARLKQELQLLKINPPDMIPTSPSNSIDEISLKTAKIEELELKISQLMDERAINLGELSNFRSGISKVEVDLAPKSSWSLGKVGLVTAVVGAVGIAVGAGAAKALQEGENSGLSLTNDEKFTWGTCVVSDANTGDNLVCQKFLFNPVYINEIEQSCTDSVEPDIILDWSLKSNCPDNNLHHSCVIEEVNPNFMKEVLIYYYNSDISVDYLCY